MKCPKCGSEELIITNYNEAEIVERLKESHYKCKLCDTRFNEHAFGTVCVISKTPTTAEMLLWLAENESIDIWHTATEGIIYVWRNGNAIKFEGKTLTEAIKQAYNWAKQEVTE